MTQPSPFAVGDEVSAAWLNQFLTWMGGTSTAYTPALTAFTTNPTLGLASSVAGKYVQVGKLVAGQGLIQFGSSGTAAGNGVYFVNLPMPVDAIAVPGQIMGGATLKCAGLFTRCDLYLNQASPGQCRLAYTSAAVNGTYNSTSNALPGAWTANDSIEYWFLYPTT